MYASAMANAKSQVDAYYKEIDLADQLRRAGRAPEALRAALSNMRRVRALVAETTREYGRFDLGSIPPIETGVTLAAVLGDMSAMQKIRGLVESIPELTPWVAVVEQGERDLASVCTILSLVSTEPGTVQSTLGKRTAIDGHRASNLSYHLAQAGRLRREKVGASYQLFCTEKS